MRTVYDEDGAVFALKCFEADEDDETLAVETLREISTLRLMRGKVGHAGIVRMIDVIAHEGEVCMVMPKYPCNLTEAVEGKAVGKNKLKIAHGLLSSVAYMHAQGFMHRDIKGDNVMLTDDMEPVLIDLSLAKPLSSDSAMTHTGNVGTAKYISPETYRSEPYGPKADIWSVGVVLLEMFIDKILKCERDKAAFAAIEKITAELPDAKPSTAFLRAMLQPEASRASAAEALGMEPLASKFPASPFEKMLNVVPVDVPGASAAGEAGGKKGKGRKTKGGGASKGGELEASVRKYWDILEQVNKSTLQAAVHYARACAAASVEVDPSHCALLASKLYEDTSTCYDLDEVEEVEGMEKFDKEAFMEAEKKIFRAVDYCLWLPGTSDDSNPKAAKQARK